MNYLNSHFEELQSIFTGYFEDKLVFLFKQIHTPRYSVHLLQFPIDIIDFFSGSLFSSQFGRSLHLEKQYYQENIRVGCVPTAAVASPPGGGGVRVLGYTLPRPPPQRDKGLEIPYRPSERTWDKRYPPTLVNRQTPLKT